MEEQTRYWSPWDEGAWKINVDMVGAPPRDARQYHPPLSTASMLAPWVMTVVVGIPTVWLVMRFLAAESLLEPLVTLAILGVLGGLLLWGPGLVRSSAPKRNPELALQLRLANEGVVAMAQVERVEYGRVTTRSGYRDGTKNDTSTGVAHLALETSAGRKLMPLEFEPSEPSLCDGDEVTVVFLEDEPSVWLPVYRMNDIELVDQS